MRLIAIDWLPFWLIEVDCLIAKYQVQIQITPFQII